MEALKNAIVTATAASTTGEKASAMEFVRELVKDFFESPDGRIIVNEAIDNYMSSPDGVAMVNIPFIIGNCNLSCT